MKAIRIHATGGQKSCPIINISSIVSRMSYPSASAYAGTKAAIEAFTHSWAAELGGRSILVNSVSPGMVETDMMRESTTSEMQEGYRSQSPLRRISQPSDIADVVTFLCSEEARWLTGQDLLVSGGVG